MAADNGEQKGTVREVFESVVWPAVAGNVLWSFLTVVCTQDRDWIGAARSTSLLAVGVYLTGSWRRTRRKGAETMPGYFILDGVYASLISVFAVCTATMDAMADFKVYVIASAALLGMFATAAVGHWKGFWAPYDFVDPSALGWERFLRGAFSAAAAVALLAGLIVWRPTDFSRVTVDQKTVVVSIHLAAIAMVIAVLTFRRVCLRRKGANSEIKKQEGKEAGQGEETPKAAAPPNVVAPAEPAAMPPVIADERNRAQ